MQMTDVIDNLTYIAYEYNRDKGMSHESLADILPIAPEMAVKYKAAYDTMEEILPINKEIKQ